MQKVVFCLALVCLQALAASTEHQHGVELYQQKNYADAISVLTEVSKTEAPDSADFKESALLIGQSYFMMNQGPKAIPWLEKVGPLNEANFMLGYAYFLNHDPDHSEAAFARLFEVKPDSAAGHLVAGQMLLKREYEKEAQEEIDKALVMDPKIPQAHFMLGEIAIYAGRAEEGVAEMLKELAINPNYAMAWYRLGDAYSRQENWAAAIPQLQRSIWLNQNFSGPYILLGKCYLKQKNFFNAESMLRKAVSLDPGNYSGTYLLAQTLMAEEKKDEARVLLEKLKTMEHDR
jgi:predicted Zn-dependent protease